MSNDKEAFRPRDLMGGAIYRTLFQRQGDLPFIGIKYDAGGVDVLTAFKTIPGLGQYSEFLKMYFVVGEDGTVESYGDPKPRGELLTVIANEDGLDGFNPRYYQVRYRPKPENPNIDVIRTPILKMSKEYRGNKLFIAELYRFDQDTPPAAGATRTPYQVFEEVTGLPERVNLEATAQMYLTGEIEQNGQSVPLSREALARRLVIAA